MAEKLDLLVLLSAIATAEGYFVPNSVPARCNNPGDLRYAGQDGSKPSNFGGTVPFAQFDSPGRGIAANLRQLCKRIQEGNSLRQLVTLWAPPSDGNSTELYLSETIRRIKVATGLEIDADRQLWDYLVIERIP